MQAKPSIPPFSLSLKSFVSCLIFYCWVVSVGANAGQQELPSAGQLQLQHESGQVPALHVGTHVELSIKGLHATVNVTQEFRNNTDFWVNALYSYPLSDESAVHDLRMHIGNRLIVGEIHEKTKAQKIYQSAKKSGKKAALLEQQRPNLFSQKIANIAPGETIKITVGYIQPVRYDSGDFSFRLPMTLTPRYIPGVVTADIKENETFSLQGSGWAKPTDLVSDAHLITPAWSSVARGKLLNPISINITLDSGIRLASVHSNTHSLEKTKKQLDSGDIYSLNFTNGQVSMVRDFELVWSPAPGDAPEAAFFKDAWKGDNYVQLLLMPPRTLSETQILPRELLLIIDTSGSMGGASMRQAKGSALMALETLKATDRFNLIDFNSDTHSLFAGAVEVSPDNLDRARRYIQSLQADGGTNMEPALALAFSHKAPETHLQQIVFVTDGSVGNEAQLLTQIHRDLNAARLFTVAIGSAPNRYFMREAAKFGRGSFTEISTAGQVRERMDELLHKLQNPMVSNLNIEWPQPVEAYPRTVPDLYWGEPLLVTAKLNPWPLDSNAAIIITGVSAGKAWRREIPIKDLLKESSENESTKIPMLAKHFGRKKINHLEGVHHNARNSSEARNDILTTALDYQLMSRFTSLVAVDKTPSRPLNVLVKNKTIPNAKPHGSTLMAASYPQGATDLWFNFLVGFIALLALFGFQYKRQRNV